MPLQTENLLVGSKQLLLQTNHVLLNQLGVEDKAFLLILAIILASLGIYSFYKGIKHLPIPLILSSMTLAYCLQTLQVFQPKTNQQISIASYNLDNDRASVAYLLNNIVASGADLIAISGMPHDQLPLFQNELVANGYCFPQLSSSKVDYTYEALFSKFPTYHTQTTNTGALSMVEVPWENGVEIIHFYATQKNQVLTPDYPASKAWVRPTLVHFSSEKLLAGRGYLPQPASLSLRHSHHFECLSFEPVHNQNNSPVGFVGQYMLLEAPANGPEPQNTEL